MDPEATLELYREARRAGDREQEAEAKSSLIEWWFRGGFEPKWTPEEKARILTI